MEQFFKAAHVPDDEMVSITSMYLSSDAKLWWRTRMGDNVEYGRPQITTWETLKKELKEQFLPTNSAWLVRESLKLLKHTSSLREYVKEFSSIMLDIRNMSNEDKLFNFISGLQGWAQTELRRQGVHDLPTAMATADCLVDYKIGSAINTTGKSKIDGGKKGKEEGKPSFNKKAGWKGIKKGAAKKQSMLRQPQTLCSRQRDQWDASFAMALTEPRIAPKEKNSVPWSLSMTRLALIQIHPPE